MGNEMGFCFGVSDDLTEISSVEGDQWCAPLEGCVLLSNLDGVEFLKGDSEFPLLQWKHSEPNTHGETGSALLECSPLSRWDPFEQRELEVTQAVEEGEFLGLEGKNSKWVVNLMKSFYKIVGFPIVKHEDQCLALFRLLEQDYIDVVNVGKSKGIGNTRQKGLRELKGLISSINYDGVHSKGRDRVSSVGTEVLTSFK